MKINKWIVTLVLALVVCGPVQISYGETTMIIVDKNDYKECPSGNGHYYHWDKATHYDADYHYMIGTCEYCGDRREIGDLHEFDEGELEKATPKRSGVVTWYCEYCDFEKNSAPIKWEYGKWGCASYDVNSFSSVYNNSRSITVRLQNGLKGAILKVTIGNKTYKKKLINNKNSITLKINRHPLGSKIRFKVTYKGRVIGKDGSDQWARVIYAKQVRNGMTKDQVRWTWGAPDDTSSASGGWSYWYYEDGSYVGFQNGHVRYWYDTAG